MLANLIRLPSAVRLACCVAVVSVLTPGVRAQTPLGHGYTRHGDDIYFDGGGTTGPNGETRIDAPSKENVEGFEKSLGRKVTLCTELDGATFVPLSEEYSRDQNRVYYKWISPGRFLVIELPKADAASFEVLSGVFAKDANTVWYMDEPIARSDPASFVVVDHRTGKDRNHTSVANAFGTCTPRHSAILARAISRTRTGCTGASIRCAARTLRHLKCWESLSSGRVPAASFAAVS